MKLDLYNYFKVIFIWVIVCIISSCANTASYKLMSDYPHDTTSFTQGLEIFDWHVYEWTWLYGKSLIKKYDLVTWSVLASANLDPKYFWEGISILDNKLYQLTWKSWVWFIYDVDDLSLMSSFNYEWEGWWLCNDWDNLIMSNWSSVINFIDPSSFEIVRSIKVSQNWREINNLNELEYVNWLIYANIWMTDDIAIISPETWNVISVLDLEWLLKSEERADANVLNWIAYDKDLDKLYLTWKLWPKIFEIEINF